MRFSKNGWYIERYVKCATCGMLVYGEGIAGSRHGKACTYCTPWCVEWAAKADSAVAAAHATPRALLRPSGPLSRCTPSSLSTRPPFLRIRPASSEPPSPTSAVTGSW